MITLHKVETAYMVCALWSSIDDEDRPLDDLYSIDDIASSTRERMRSDVAEFIDFARDDLLESGLDCEQIGHDFWLTRNQHGAGFWDRGLSDDLGHKLSDIARAFMEVHLYVGDDGLIYQG